MFSKLEMLAVLRKSCYPVFSAPSNIIARIKLTYCAPPTLIQQLYERRNGPATIDTKERLIENVEARHEEAKNGKGSCHRLFSGFHPEFRVFVA
jgi:hypothetical protein